MSKSVQKSLDLVREARNGVNKELAGTEFSHQLLELNALFKRMETRLIYMGAIDSPNSSGVDPVKDDKFPPISNFMGRKVGKATKVAPVDIVPPEDLKKKFRADVEALLQEVGDIDNKALLSKYSGTPYEKILRGVAKLASVKDFNTRMMNDEFIDEVKLGAAIVLEEREQKKNLDENTGKKKAEAGAAAPSSDDDSAKKDSERTDSGAEDSKKKEVPPKK